MLRPLPRRLLGVLGVVALLAVLGPPAVAAPGDPGDPLWPQQWGHRQVGAAFAWPSSTGTRQRIAIVDSGVDLDHPDLVGKIADGVTFLGCPQAPDGCGDGDWRDQGASGDGAPSGHGTHVAGIAAATTGNGMGVAGVAPGAQILSVKVLSGDLGGRVDDVAAGIRWAVRHGATVVNLSLGGRPGQQAGGPIGQFADLEAAVAEAVAAGVVVLAAAGNDFASLCAEPAFGQGTLCVVATDRHEQRAAYSNLAVDERLSVVAAPGGAAVLGCAEDIVAPVPAGSESPCGARLGLPPGYDALAGTSMAAPHVAGIAALLRAQGRSATETVDVLIATARTPGSATRGTYTPTYGFGIVDATAAVTRPRNEVVVERHAGLDRVATAVAVSRRSHQRASSVVLARADDYADALAGAPLAGHLGGPLLLSDRGGLPEAVAVELRRLQTRTAVLLGSEAALSEQVARDLRALGVASRRVGGVNRFATAALVAAELPDGAGAFVTEGVHAEQTRGWPDALSASGLATAERAPILLVTRDVLPAETAAALSPEVDVTIVGGEASVGTAVAAALDEAAGSVTRLAGADRYATSVRVAGEAERRGHGPGLVWLATGAAFADGLAAGAAAGAAGGLLLLVAGEDLDRSPAAVTFLQERAARLDSLLLAGGRGAISADSERRLRGMFDPR